MFDILESGDNKPFKIKGIAMIKDSLSKNGKFYSGKLVDSVVDKVSSIIESNGSYPLSMMADHPGVTSNKTLSTIGRLTAMYVEGNNAIIEAEIANTSVGKDVQELIRGKFVEGLSIRATNGKFKKKYINDKIVNDVLEMDLRGVDLVVNPGVDGAKVLDILESDETSNGVFISIEESEENPKGVNNMEFDLMKTTLEEFKAKRPDLYESVKAELKPIHESELGLATLQESINTLQESFDNLTAENGTLQESFDALKSEKETLESDLQEAKKSLNEIAESEKRAKLDTHITESVSKLTFAESIKNKLAEKAKLLESVEEIDAMIESESEYLNMVIKEATGVNPAGIGSADNKDSKSKIEEEEQEFLNLLEGM